MRKGSFATRAVINVHSEASRGAGGMIHCQRINTVQQTISTVSVISFFGSDLSDIQCHQLMFDYH